MFEEKRGRPRGRLPLHYKYIKSIVLIARKHDLDPELLADAFFEAWENEVSHCVHALSAIVLASRSLAHEASAAL